VALLPPAMDSPTLHFPVFTRLVMIALLAIAVSAGAQEVRSVPQRSATAPSDEPPSPLLAPRDPLAGEKRTEGFDLGVILSVAYDSNIFLSATNERSDFVTRVAPKIAYSIGDRDSQDGGYLKVAYSPSGVVYAGNSDDNRVDHVGAVSVGVIGKMASLDYSLAYGKSGDATADAGRVADRSTLDHVVRIAWVPREKLALEVAAGQSLAEYADKVLLDSREAFGEFALKYAYSPKTRLSLAYRAGRFEVDGADDQRFHRVMAGIEWQPREKLRVELAAGAEKRKFSSGSEVTPVMEGRIGWKASEKTDLYLTAYRRETASAFSVGQNYRLTGLTAGFSQKIGDRWTARLEAGAERASYRYIDGSSGDAGHDDLWFVRPSIEYRFSEQFGLEVFCRISRNDSTRPGFGYDQQNAGVSLQYRF
jgi:hypothetical protein